MIDNLEKGKAIKLVYGIIITILLLCSAIIIFDDNYTNNKIGLLLLFFAYVFRGIYDLFKAVKEGNKKWIFFEALFLIIAFCIFIWSLIKYIAWNLQL